MDQAPTHSLPNGKQVPVCTTISDEHFDGAVRYTLRELVAEDPDQPRKYFDQEELAELTESIAAEGIRDPLVLTPAAHAPWIRYKPGQEGRPLFIVSGNRRWIATSKADVQIVPFRIEIYEDENAHRAAADIYNGPRAGLSEIEEAYEMARRRKAGATYQQIASSKGKSLNYVMRRLCLVRLAPEIRAELEEEATSKKTLPITVAEDLGTVEAPKHDELLIILDEFDLPLEAGIGEDEDSLRFCLQRTLLTVIRRERYNATRARLFIQTRKRSIQSSGAHQRYVDSHKPSRRIDMLRALIEGVTGTPVQDWPKDEWDRVFHNADRTDVMKILGQLGEVKDVIQAIEVILNRIASQKKPRTSPEQPAPASAPLERRPESAASIEKDEPIPTRPLASTASQESPAAISRRSRPSFGALPRRHPAPPPKTRPSSVSKDGKSFAEFTAVIWSESSGRYDLTKVERHAECERLFKAKLFKFQREKDVPPPGDFPADLLVAEAEVV